MGARLSTVWIETSLRSMALSSAGRTGRPPPDTRYGARRAASSYKDRPRFAMANLVAHLVQLAVVLVTDAARRLVVDAVADGLPQCSVPPGCFPRVGRRRRRR